MMRELIRIFERIIRKNFEKIIETRAEDDLFT